MMISGERAASLMICIYWLQSGSSEVAANTSNPVLNVARYSLDDEYRGCVKAMRCNLGSIIQSDLENSELYRNAWVEALNNWQVNKSWLFPQNMKELYEVAILAYTLQSPPLYQEFNTATRTAAKGPEEYEAYPFKSLHFLLTQAARAFQSKEPKCIKGYRGTSVKFSVKDLFRFGQFTSISESAEVARRFGTVTFFKVHTCMGFSISEMSYFEEEEVLIPPFEIFQVTLVEDTSAGKIIGAKSRGSCSNHNCAFVGKGEKKGRHRKVFHF